MILMTSEVKLHFYEIYIFLHQNWFISECSRKKKDKTWNHIVFFSKMYKNLKNKINIKANLDNLDSIVYFSLMFWKCSARFSFEELEIRGEHKRDNCPKV